MDQNNNQKNKKNNGMVLISLFFLIWFVLSLAAMIYFAKKGQAVVSVMVLGQFLLCFGIVSIIAAIRDKAFNPIILLFPVSGIGCIIGGAIYQFGTETVIAETEKMLPDIVGGIFLIAGIIMVIARFIRSGKKKRLCTAPVTATCVNIESRFRRGHKSICPTYEISYRDEMIRLCNNTFTSLNDLTIGEKRTVYVNPSDPLDFYEPKEKRISSVITNIIGIAFVIGGILIFVMLHI